MNVTLFHANRPNRNNRVFTPESLSRLAGQTVPVRVGIGGPVIGMATMRDDGTVDVTLNEHGLEVRRRLLLDGEVFVRLQGLDDNGLQAAFVDPATLPTHAVSCRDGKTYGIERTEDAEPEADAPAIVERPET